MERSLHKILQLTSRNFKFLGGGCQCRIGIMTRSKFNYRRTFGTAASVKKDEALSVKSHSPDVETVVGKTVPEFIWDRVLQWDNAPATECALTGRSYTYADLYCYSRGFGAGLIKLGLKRSDVIGLVLPNTPEFPIALLGSLEGGAIVSTINPGYTPHEITRQLNSSDSKYVVTMEQYLPAVLKARESCPSIKSVIVIGSSVPEGCLSFYELMKTNPKGFEFLRGSDIDINTIALLPYSSGTSGLPKGVTLSHSNLATNVLQHSHPAVGTATSLAVKGRESQEKFIALIPLFHIFGLHTYNFLATYEGAHTLCIPKFEPAVFVKAIRQHKPTVLHLVPPLVNFICQSPEIGRKELESIHSIVAGAAPIGEVLINKLLEKAGKYIFFQEAWGMSELSPMALMLSPSTKNQKIGSCGSPIPSTVCKIVDSDGVSLGPNKNGELCVRGPQVMKGYLNNEKATSETLIDGWLHTGDVGYYDEDRCFYIVDRLKELIKVKGFQVAPSELEDLLREHKDVVDVAVIGVPDPKSGELPRAYIVTRNKDLTTDEVHEFVKDKVIAYKRLKGGIEFVDVIPKAPSGKLLRRELLADYKKKHNL